MININNKTIERLKILTIYSIMWNYNYIYIYYYRDSH